jgi:hypothetical protein
MRSALALLLAYATAPTFAGYKEEMAALPKVLEQVYGSTDIDKQTNEFVSHYNLYILAGIDGTWIPVSDLGMVDEPKFLDACKGLGAVRITRTSNYQFTLVGPPKSVRAAATTYTYTGGNMFVFASDPDERIKTFVQHPEDPVFAPMVASALHSGSGFTTIYKPTDDMLVFQDNLAKPRVYGRCP